MNQSTTGQEFRREMEGLMEQLKESLATVILETDDRIALPPGAAAALADFYTPLPETGSGAAQTIDRLLELNHLAAQTSRPWKKR